MSMDKLKNNKKESISKAIKMSTLAKIKNFISTSKFTKKKSRFASNEKFGKSAGDISKLSITSFSFLINRFKIVMF